MESNLLYETKKSGGTAPYPSFSDIYKDLSLNILLKTMSMDDPFMMEQIRSVMMVPVQSREELAYRYDIVREFQDRPELCDNLYTLARKGYQLAEEFRREKEQNRGKTAARSSMMIATIRFIDEVLAVLDQIGNAVIEEGELSSQGLRAFQKRMDGYPIKELQDFHKKLLFYTTGGEGIFSIRISGGLKISRSRLCDCQSYHVVGASSGSSSGTLKKLYYKLAKKDSILVEGEALEKDIQSFVELNMQKVMEIYSPWVEDVLQFFTGFAREMAFYRGIHSFQNRMKELHLPLCYGEITEERGTKDIEDLYELSLALYTQTYPVPNSLGQRQIHLTIITGANQGGKSTFLRSFGIAQVMMQCGMPVPAARFISGLYSRIHTHFTRKEDAMLSRGRLEEELKRMSDIVSQISGDSLLLLNESFASTTEKEGSQIAHNIILPLYEKGIEVMMVTHLHEFASDMYEKKLSSADFLIAERRADGERTYHMLPGKPHYSSYGTDLYQIMIDTAEE